MNNNKTKKTDYDSPWKEVLEYYFKQAMEFYFPEGMENKLEQTILEYEEERKMKYVTSIERIGIKQGLQQGSQQSLLKGIALGLELKFGDEGLRELPEIRKITDIDVLNAILERIKTLSTINELRKIYQPAS